MKSNKDIRFYQHKIVISGDIIEVYRSDLGFFKGFINDRGRAGNGFTTDEQRKKNRELSLMRARRELRRIVNANIGQWGDDVTCKFLTLTFEDNIKNLDVANYEFKKFIQRLNYLIYGVKCSKLMYTAVIEFQKRGAVHYHVIFYNLPYMKADILAEVWGNGFIKVNKIDDIDNIGAYVCKYLTKDNDDCRLKGRKSYFNSRGVKKPIEVYLNDNDFESIKDTLPEQAVTYEGQFDNEYLGIIEYKQYNLRKLF